MNINLTGKTALITGAAKGIGLGIAKAFDAAGARTIIASLESVAEVDKKLKKNNTPLDYYCVDLSTAEACCKLVDKLKEDGIKIDILVNNAGIQFTAQVHQFPFDKWQQIIAINLSAAFYLSSLLLPAMQQQGFGRIINISSVHGQVASINKAAYVSTKHGLIGLTKAIALENAAKGITCNAICPGFVHTDMVEVQIKEKAKSSGYDEDSVKKNLLSEKHPSLEFVTVEQLGAVAVFVASPHASQINGICLPVDGGWLAQ